ncbi:MAG: biotin--[acetyl-CoA-carboxylase] ligase [Bacteroidales bacterium]|nr:biotin--[acetyl-CoA-carboxylase] ligase [Bacteroidales bacterium]
MRNKLNIISVDKVDSTNKFACKILQKGRPVEGTIINTQYQFAGKGQGENFWESEAGKNLTISIILYPDFIYAEEEFILNKAVSLAVYNFIMAYIKDEKVSIKWPNDIYVNKNKIAGILINNTIIGNRIDYSIIGIGININQTKFLSSAPNPVSLKNITGIDYNINNCIEKLYDFIEKAYIELKAKKFKKIRNNYLKHIFQYKTWNKYLYNNEIITAKIIGISQYGKLILEKKEASKNSIIECANKEIEYLLK